MLEVGEFQAQLPFSKGDPPAEEATGHKQRKMSPKMRSPPCYDGTDNASSRGSSPGP